MNITVHDVIGNEFSIDRAEAERIVEIMADALRYGITWDKLIQGVMLK